MFALVSMLAALAASASPGAPEVPRSLPIAGKATRDLSKPPKLLNRAELMTVDDYPLAARFFDQQGSVRVAVAVDENGKIADCVVEQSSGFPALDTQTCRLFWLRARFEPGRDELGRLAGTTYHQTIVWRLEDRRAPAAPWLSRLVWTVDKNGALISCHAETKGIADTPGQNGCIYVGQLPAQARLFGFGPRSDRVTIMLESQFAPDGTALTPHSPAGPNERVYSLQTSRLALDAEGKVANCKPVDQAGINQLAGHDTCEDVRGLRFEPSGKSRSSRAPAGGLLLIGTWVSD